MTEQQKPNTIAKLLAEKKAKKNSQNNTFNPKGGNALKPSKGFGGPSVVRRTGRGK